MKSIFYSFIIATFFWGCTQYSEEILTNVQDYKKITPETVDTSLKVVNLTVNQAEFDSMYKNYNDDIKIPATLDIYKNGVKTIEDESVEIQIKGGYSAQFKLKSIGVKFDHTYHNDDRKLIDPQPLLPFHDIDRIKAFRLRNSGNDYLNTLLKDISLTKMAIEAQLDLDLMYTEQTVVFVNNEFYGIMNLRTESNTNGMEKLYRVDKDDITLAKIDDGNIEEKDGDFAKIDRFIAAINNGDYEYVSNEIDWSNYTDYMIFESYLGNMDWPDNNVRFFAIDDGPFRFILFDLDWAIAHNLSRSPRWFIKKDGDVLMNKLFRLMYNNPDFKQQYDARYNELLNSGLFSSSVFNTIVEDYKNNIELMMPTHIQKLNTPQEMAKWFFNVDEMKQDFKIREDFLKE